MSMTLPRLTADDLRAGVLEMCGWAAEMLRITREAFVQTPPSSLDRVGVLGRDIHLREKRLTDHVAMQLREAPWVLGSAEHLAFLPAALERIGDSAEALARCVRSIHRDDVPFSERAVTEVSALVTSRAYPARATARARCGASKDARDSPLRWPQATSSLTSYSRSRAWGLRTSE